MEVRHHLIRPPLGQELDFTGVDPPKRRSIAPPDFISWALMSSEWKHNLDLLSWVAIQITVETSVIQIQRHLAPCLMAANGLSDVAPRAFRVRMR